MQADVFVLHHHPSGLQPHPQIGLLAVLGKGDAVHRADIDAGIECDACVDICPMDCITFTENGEEADLRVRLKTGRVMVKDEDVCLHCGLCAERCPTGAWDMQKYLIDMTHAGTSCPSKSRSAA